MLGIVLHVFKESHIHALNIYSFYITYSKLQKFEYLKERLSWHSLSRRLFINLPGITTEVISVTAIQPLT